MPCPSEIPSPRAVHEKFRLDALHWAEPHSAPRKPPLLLALLAQKWSALSFLKNLGSTLYCASDQTSSLTLPWKSRCLCPTCLLTIFLRLYKEDSFQKVLARSCREPVCVSYPRTGPAHHFRGSRYCFLCNPLPAGRRLSCITWKPKIWRVRLAPVESLYTRSISELKLEDTTRSGSMPILTSRIFQVSAFFNSPQDDNQHSEAAACLTCSKSKRTPRFCLMWSCLLKQRFAWIKLSLRSFSWADWQILQFWTRPDCSSVCYF